MASTFTMAITNSTSVTLYGVCVVHYVRGLGWINALYIPSIAPGGTAGGIPCSTESGHQDWYYLTFGYQSTLLGGRQAMLRQGWVNCNAPSSATSMMVHLSISNYTIQYSNNKYCRDIDYDVALGVGGVIGGEQAEGGIFEGEQAEAPVAGPETPQFVLNFQNTRVLGDATVCLMHLTNDWYAPTSLYSGVTPNGYAPPLTCINDGGTGDLYSIIYISGQALCMGAASVAWNKSDPSILLRAPVSISQQTGFSYKYSSAGRATDLHWSNSMGQF